MTTEPNSFDPHTPGTPEAEWDCLLRDAPKWEPHAGSILVVSPHPDDEVLGAGGLISAHSAEGHAVTVVSVTDGEAAHPGWPRLDLVRRRELRGALVALTPHHVEIRRLGLPDGKVTQHANRLRAALLELITPRTTVIAPYPHDGHPDHEIVGAVCREVSRDVQAPMVSYPIWAWHHDASASLKKLSWGRFPLSSCAQRAKARAIDCFASQIRPPRGLPIVPEQVLAYFRRPYEAFLL